MTRKKESFHTRVSYDIIIVNLTFANTEMRFHTDAHKHGHKFNISIVNRVCCVVYYIQFIRITQSKQQTCRPNDIHDTLTFAQTRTTTTEYHHPNRCE